MASGHVGGDGEPAGVAKVVRLIQRNAGLRAFLARAPIVVRKFRVPYLAGRSRDGMVTYADESFPQRLPKTGIEPDRYISGHEGFEWWLMTRGMDYFPAHWDAEGYEHYLLKLDGVSQEGIDAYEEECQEYVSADEAARITPECVPPDLYLGPYERDEDALDKRILPILRQAQVLSMGILSMSMGV